ncbi:MAG TPA: PEGA domain-containing protein [Candidatus Eisenbacteria bacterium]|nr:PEGA domain-containing protein [Candidatus Eisenbacteria bacterium]
MLLLALVLAVALVPAPASAQAVPSDSARPALPDTAVVAGTAAAADTTEPRAGADTTAVADTSAVIPPPPPPTAILRVETRPSGLQVEVDGTPAGRSPTGPLPVTPGTHRVRALPEDPRRFGTPALDRAVTLAAGAEFTLRLDLRPPVVLRTDPEPALVTLTGRPSADSLLGSTPLSVKPSVIEPYGLRFTREAFADTTLSGTAFLSGGDPPRVPLRRIAAAPARVESGERTPLYRKKWVQWSLVGIGAVLTGAAAVWHREADRTYDEYLASSNVEEIPGLYDRTIALDRRATASFLAGQAVLITGGILLLTGQSN